MHIEDFDKVKKLVEMRNKLIEARVAAKAFYDNVVDNGPDAGGVGPRFDMGYWCHVSEHKDGSGKSIDLRGCYVATEMADATQQVITKQLLQVEAELDKLGVEIGTPEA